MKNNSDILSKYKSHAQWIGLRYVNERTSTRVIRNDKPEVHRIFDDQGVMAEVYVDGHIGYAATADLSDEGLQKVIETALEKTMVASRFKVHHLNQKEVRPATRGTYQSSRQTDLKKINAGQIEAALINASQAMSDKGIVNRVASAMLIETDFHLLSTDGRDIQQSFQMSSVQLAATAEKGSEHQTRTISFDHQWGAEAFEKPLLQTYAQQITREALELLIAENCPSGTFDLLLMPDQMMLQIHESIGHPLEVDRILGDERNYAGWSFIQPQDFGRLQYGSSLLNVTFDPTVKGEFASYSYDDSGAPAEKLHLIQNGLLVRGLGGLESQVRSQLPGVANFRSASWNRAPIDRMANINIEPGHETLEELIKKMKFGVLMKTNKSWSIDDYRNKFQFGCEYAELIENGKKVKTLKNPNYRGTTVDFWNKLIGLGKDTQTYGTPYCGKGEPNQVIRVGHSSPPCLFKDVEIFGGGQ